MKPNCRKKVLNFGEFSAKLRTAVASHVPTGYEDEAGFHYGTNASDGSFSIFDSVEQPRRSGQQRFVIS